MPCLNDVVKMSSASYNYEKVSLVEHEATSDDIEVKVSAKKTLKKTLIKIREFFKYFSLSLEMPN